MLSAICTLLLMPNSPQKTAYYVEASKKAPAYEVKIPKIAGSAAATACTTNAIALAKKELADYVKEAKQQIKEWPESKTRYMFDMEGFVRANKTEFSCIQIDHYIDMAGAHPNHTSYMIRMGIVKGNLKKVELRDVFKNGEAGRLLCNDKIVAKLKKEEASWVMEEDFRELSDQQLSRWYPTKEGIQFIFPPYEVASYAEGEKEALVKWSDLKQFIDPKGPLGSYVK